MKDENQIEFEKAVDKGRNNLLGQAGLSIRQITYDMEYVFEKVFPEQEIAYRACQSFVEKYFKSNDTNGLILIGPVGSGKTMLASYVIHSLIFNTYSANELVKFAGGHYQKDQNDFYSFIMENYSKYLLLNISYFLSELRIYTGIENSYYYNNIMRYVKDIDVLIFDDLGTEKSTEWTKSVLFEIIDYRYNNYLPIIITTNCLPDELKEKIGERSVDRLREMCKLVTINSSSFRKTAE